MWLDADTIAWSGAADSTYRLLYDPDGGIEVEAEKTACRFPEPQAPCYVDLKPDGRNGDRESAAKPDVQAEIRGYLQALLDAGVAGFRIDAGKPHGPARPCRHFRRPERRFLHFL